VDVDVGCWMLDVPPACVEYNSVLLWCGIHGIILGMATTS